MKKQIEPPIYITLYLAAAGVLLMFFLCCSASLADELRGRDRAEEFIVKELEFKKTRVQDAVRVISELSGVNIVATQAAGEKKVTFFVRDLTVSDVVDSMCRISGLWYRYNQKTGIFIVMTTAEYQRDIVVFRYEPTRKFQLKYLNVGIAARTIADLFGERVELLGKADRHYGDDFQIDSIADDPFTEDIDDGDEFSSSSSSSSSNSTTRSTSYRSSSSSSRSRERPSLETGSLTPTMLNMLEERMNEQILAVTDGQVSQVSQRTEAQIYITVNRLHNMLFVRTSDEKAMDEISKIIEDSDQQVPEVLLEMKVLEIQLTDQFQSAFDISNISGSDQTGPDDGQIVNPLNPESGSVGSSLLGLGNFGLIEDPTLVFQSLSENLRVRIQLLEQNDNIKSLATPMLMAANNHPAKLFIGEETVLTTGFEAQQVEVSSGTNVSVSTLPVPVTEVTEIGNTLTILPSINADRSVVMRIVHENSTVELGGGQIPVLLDDSVEYVSIDTINTSKLEGTVLAQNGMTIAVGGMIRTQTVDSEDKVPVLGDIPLLGFFFKEQLKSEIKTELVLLITPHILSAPDQGEEVTRQRLGELSAHPSDLDQYFDSLDRGRREKMERAAAGADAAQGPYMAGGNRVEQGFVEMTKIAVKQVRTPYLMRKQVGAVRPVVLRALGEVPVFSYKGVVSKPVASWTNGYHFVTALKVINRTGKNRVIDTADLNGVWRAATLERQELAPNGEDGDFTYLYLISDFSFEKVVNGEVN